MKFYKGPKKILFMLCMLISLMMVAPAYATNVSTCAELEAAWGDYRTPPDAEIVLMNDIVCAANKTFSYYGSLDNDPGQSTVITIRSSAGAKYSLNARVYANDSTEQDIAFTMQDVVVQGGVSVGYGESVTLSNVDVVDGKIDAYNCGNISLSDVTVDNAGDTYSISLSYNRGTVDLTNISISNGDGLYVYDGTTVTLNDVSVASTREQGYGLSLRSVDELIVDGLDIDFVAPGYGRGIALATVDGGEIRNVTIDDTKTHYTGTGIPSASGFEFMNVRNVAFSNVEMNNIGTGISAQDVYDCTFDTMVINNALNGIYGQYYQRMDFVDVSIGNCDAAVNLVNVSDLTFSDCEIGVDPSRTVAWPVKQGMVFSRAQNITIADSIIANAKADNPSATIKTSHGISIGKMCHHFTVENNVIGMSGADVPMGNDHYGIEVSWASDCRIAGNVIAYNGLGGIYQSSPYNERNTFTRNIIFSNNGNKAIDDSDLNYRKTPPVFAGATASFVTGYCATGSCLPGDKVELFEGDAAGLDALVFLGEATVDANLEWTVPGLDLRPGTVHLTATITDEWTAAALGMTSELSAFTATIQVPAPPLEFTTYTQIQNNYSMAAVQLRYDITGTGTLDGFTSEICFQIDASKTPVAEVWYPDNISAVAVNMGGGVWCVEIDMSNISISAGQTYPVNSWEQVQLGIHYQDWSSISASLVDPHALIFSGSFMENDNVTVYDLYDHLLGGTEF
ncbi:MAG: right-handed parallel beta-helix repeat-containing protein [Deltaproteobacteria bacterium]|nr:right-handed parallel beta-helix repeat-containing protein [Deltaproteobacteria bacterium]